MAESTCTQCGLAFTGLTAFDAHLIRIPDHPFVACVDPRHVGLSAKVRTASGRRRTVWGYPTTGEPPWAQESIDAEREVPS